MKANDDVIVRHLDVVAACPAMLNLEVNRSIGVAYNYVTMVPRGWSDERIISAVVRRGLKPRELAVTMAFSHRMPCREATIVTGSVAVWMRVVAKEKRHVAMPLVYDLTRFKLRCEADAVVLVSRRTGVPWRFVTNSAPEGRTPLEHAVSLLGYVGKHYGVVNVEDICLVVPAFTSEARLRHVDSIDIDTIDRKLLCDNIMVPWHCMVLLRANKVTQPQRVTVLPNGKVMLGDIHAKRK